MAKQGWATGMVAGNVYLSSNFDMADGWGLHRCVNWLQGSTQIRRGEASLNDHADQPSFLLLPDGHAPAPSLSGTARCLSTRSLKGSIQPGTSFATK